MYQSTHTGAQVDEAVGKALNPDAAPTQDSTNLVQSGGVASAVSAVQNTVSRRNLLDNWFFANPVNQRGLTSYSTNDAYCIDRWKYYGTIPMTLQSDGIRLGDTTSNTVTYIRQFIDTPQLYAGKTLTYSVLVKDLSGTEDAKGFIRWYVNNVEQTASIIAGELTTLTLTIPSSPTSLCFDIGTYWNRAFTVVSAKLEIGSVSTLANDSPPNYAEELAKCQYYFYRLKAGEPLYGSRSIGAVNFASFRVPVIMRATPTATKNGGTITIYGQNGVQYGFSSFNNSAIDYNAIGVYLSQNGSYAGEKLVMFNSGGTIDLSADL